MGISLLITLFIILFLLIKNGPITLSLLRLELRWIKNDIKKYELVKSNELELENILGDSKEENALKRELLRRLKERKCLICEQAEEDTISLLKKIRSFIFEPSVLWTSKDNEDLKKLEKETEETLFQVRSLPQ